MAAQNLLQSLYRPFFSKSLEKNIIFPPSDGVEVRRAGHMRLMPTKAVAFRPAGGIKKPMEIMWFRPVWDRDVWGTWRKLFSVLVAWTQIDGKMCPPHRPIIRAKTLQKNVLKPFLYRFCWACHRSVSRHFPGPNLGDGHMPECRVCLIAGAPPPSKTETPRPFKFLYKPLLQNVEGGGSKSVPLTNRSWTSQTAKLPYIFWVLSPTSWFLGISGGS